VPFGLTIWKNLGKRSLKINPTMQHDLKYTIFVCCVSYMIDNRGFVSSGQNGLTFVD
jgi:hypothetical protein